ncbi:MAG: AIPR family protein [Urechidicola sp.]|nr:AIPR family protein [Urechidicola sp.]
MISIEEFHQDFLQSILSDASSRGLMKSQAFFENVCEELISAGDLTKNYTNADYAKKGLEAHGFDYDDERKILSLLVHQFFQTDEIETLTKQHIDTKFKRLESFYTKSTKGLHSKMEETSEAYDMAYQIYQWHEDKKIEKIKLIVFTDGKATRTLLGLPNKRLDGIEIEFRVIDISYLHKIYLSEAASGVFEVNTNLPYLQVNSDSDEYQSYLSCISGDELAKIYDEFGQKLFEQNVRTFLQFRGNVNKGLRNTIEGNPTMFFAYNNGITATATNVEIEGNKIKKIHNLQIVNGGQTTSAIYAAVKNFKQDVSRVSVQMKLSVVKNYEKQNDFVSKVSEYANTQNKINKSDFFSNNPFHKDFKNHSKRILAPTSDGSQLRTYWFYERVRGEYLNEQAYLTPAKKRQFQLEHPKLQVLDKTFLSKSENTWLQKPNIVSKGAQYSFREFADTVTSNLEKDELAITEKYFKDAICRAILFRNTEKMVSKSNWYDGGFRAQTVTYSIAYLAYYISQKEKFLDFGKIWEIQNLPEVLELSLKVITQKVYQALTHPPEGHANISQYCKKDFCWEGLKKMNVDISLEGLLIDKEEEKYSNKIAKKEKKLDMGIEIQTFILKLEQEKRDRLLEYYQKDDKTSPMKLDILKKYCYGNLLLPSEKQSKVLYELYNKATEEGFCLD